MTEFPPSLTKHSTQWFVVVALTVAGDLAGMLATFMPMKVVLILASGDVPGFFPDFLIDGGAVFASLVLLLVAGLFGVMAWLTGVVIARMDRGPVQWAGNSGQLSDWKSESFQGAKKTRTFESSIIVTLPVIAVLLLVSPPYLGFSAVWLVLSAIGVVLFVRRSSKQAPFFSGVDQFSHALAKWLRTSALGSMVGLALITLLVSPPALGSTAILIAAIFGRRLIIAVAELVPQATVALTHRALATTGASRAQTVLGSLVTNQPTAGVVRWPIEFFSSALGARRLGEHLEAAGFGRWDFAVVGAPSGPSLSLIAGPDSSSRQLLIRVFGTQHEEARDRELLRRQHSGQSGLFPDLTPQRGVVAGFPAIEVELDSPEVLANLDTPVSSEEAIVFQLERELASVLAFSGDGFLGPTGFIEAEFIERLTRAARIPGPHAADCAGLTTRIGEALEHVHVLPPALVPSKPLGPNDFYKSQTETLCYLGGHTWSVGRMGYSWGPGSRYAKHLKTIINNRAADGTTKGAMAGVINIDALMLNAELHALHRALHGFQLGALSAAVAAVHTGLDSRGLK
jgi:hypothetical protein